MPSALAVFTCRPNSHPFQERHVYLDEPVKIGRSVARCRPAQNNATFDCKVLSRNHALVWFDHKTGKFYLQDTKSSNGTFINSQRLSRGSEESPPCELLSGDIIQFGVDVTENTRKVTHGCIVSTVKLFLPDGVEARRRSDVIQAPLPLPVDKVAANAPSMYSQELFQLSQYLQEALHREQMLEQKLATLQRLLSSTQEASMSSWQALIDEDRLLSRLEVMGNQLQAYSKTQTEDGIRKELVALQEDKHNYETTAKESLRRVLQEKIEVVRKLSEVERSLSNTEDECTHLKEMNERTQEELRELANKYNGAVNEIKDLTDKIKLAEGRQEELLLKGQTEKKELQLRISEMEEKEQALQARVEALQADNDFSNERLTALQAVKQAKGAVPSPLKKISDFDEVIDAHLQNNQLTQEISLESPAILRENQIDAKELDMSDTLSPSKDRSSDDTSDGQMDEQELNEPLKAPSPRDELPFTELEPGNTEQVMEHLQRELLDAREVANSSRQRCQELQGSQSPSHGPRAALDSNLRPNGMFCVTALLDEERRANRRQAEGSAKQIQLLQAQMQKLQADMELLREQREGAIAGAREELQAAQEEVLALHRVVETAAAERERDIAGLQSDLRTVTAELEKWRQAAARYEAEIAVLQASFQQQSQQEERVAQLQGELDRLRLECSALQKESSALRAEKVALLERLQQLELELDNSRQQSCTLSSSLSALERSQGELEQQLGSLQEQHRQDAGRLRGQLTQADGRTRSLQKEYDDTQTQLSDLREQYERTEREKRSIHEELEQCRVSLKQLQDKEGSSAWLPWMPVVAVMVAMTVVVLYPGLSRSAA
ncbi:sarcolemma associated protein a isoform X6 [Brienomyrus brachyistius]|uniref:sarcolemma associated protein a isoform X6 n=1 Tax=Brienomyrus brachyistius TaxID=42636 RepID=UPI0020B31369|nr:sarcolemma associated protein a isoform X6 [Brienomyrus brachyistius]